MNPLPRSFFERDDVIQIAQDLIGKALFSSIGNTLTGGIIIETEAYKGPEDKASHAYRNRRTKRTEVMFEAGGIAYVYMCYGIHYLLNAVTSTKDTPHAVLIRALFPTYGAEEMAVRRSKREQDPTLTQGPGSVCQALGITTEHNRLFLDRPPLWIEETALCIPKEEIQCTPRIGIAYAEEHALLPWRFLLPEQNLCLLLQRKEDKTKLIPQG